MSDACAGCGGELTEGRVNGQPRVRLLQGRPYHGLAGPDHPACYWTARRRLQKDQAAPTEETWEPSPGVLPVLSRTALAAGDEQTGYGELLEMITRSRPAWQRDALCREYPDINFFPERGESPVEAQRVCARCLVRFECLEWALRQGPDLVGIWGGLSGAQRRARRSGNAA